MAIKKLINKKSIEILFISLISGFFLYSLLSNVMLEGNDCLFHMNRIQGIVNAWADGQIIPRVYPYTNNGYGYASPMFYCDIFIYPFALLYGIGVPLVISYKLMLAFYGLLSIVSIFYVSKYIEKDYKLGKYIATILYTFCNYHLYDFYARHAVGEIFAFVIYPIVLLAYYKIFIEKKSSWILLGVSYALLLLTHMISFVIYCALFAIVYITFVILNRKQKEIVKSTTITIIKGVALAILLSAFHLLPMLEQTFSQDFFIEHYSDYYNIVDSISSLKDFLYPFCWLPRIFNDGVPHYSLGTIYIFLPFIYVYLLIEKKAIIQ